MIPDKGWQVGDLAADALSGSHPPVIRGEEATLNFKFNYRNGLDPIQRYETLRDRCANSGAVSYNVMVDGTVRYREQHGGETLVMLFSPGPETDATQGFWGLVTGYKDNTTNPDVWCKLALDVAILGFEEEFANRTEVEDQLRV